jgi:malate dehydrogenase (oxaloacetate-decarboxylating)(NADP+)
MMVHLGDADAVVAGIESNYPEVIRPALQVVGRQEGVEHVAGLYMVARPNKDLLFFADTTVNISPDATTLAEIATLSAGFVRSLGIEPRIAMVSFSNFGSVRHPEVQKVQDALEMVRAQEPELTIDGEMQADRALNPKILLEDYPFSPLRTGANILVFSTLSAANAAYKLMGQIGGAEVIGPVLLGMARPVHLLQRGSTTQDVFNLATIASVDAQNSGG